MWQNAVQTCCCFSCSINNRILPSDFPSFLYDLCLVHKFLNTDFGYLKMNRLAVISVADGEEARWQPPLQPEHGVSFHQRDTRGQEALTRTLVSLPVSARACHTVQGKMSFCKVIRLQFHTEPYHSPFTSWAQTNSLFK